MLPPRVRKLIEYRLEVIHNKRVSKYWTFSREKIEELREIYLNNVRDVIVKTHDKCLELQKEGISVFVKKGYESVNIPPEIDTGDRVQYRLLHIPFDPPYPFVYLEAEEIKNDYFQSTLRHRIEERTRITEEGNRAKKLAYAVCKDFGTVNYMLTQFPELSVLCAGDAGWKPNNNYKVKTRDQFEDNDALLIFLANARIEGCLNEE